MGELGILGWIIVGWVAGAIAGMFVPGRTPDVNDLFADAIGSVAAVILVKACDIIRRL